MPGEPSRGRGNLLGAGTTRGGAAPSRPGRGTGDARRGVGAAATRRARRRLLEGTAALGAATLVLPGKAPAQGGALPLQGVTLNVSAFSAPFTKFLGESLPEFEAATEAKVNFDTPSFPVYNQRTDLELSTGGTAIELVNILPQLPASPWISGKK